MTAFLGHAYGTKAPGHHDWREAIVVGDNVLASHARAVPAFRAVGPAGGQIGITLDFEPGYAMTETDADLAALDRWDAFRNRWFLEAILHGRYPAELVDWLEQRLGPLDLQAEPAAIDFLGVNYYSRAVVGDNPNDGPIAVRRASPTLPTTGMGWEIVPDSLYELLIRLKRDYGDIPLLITENGAAYDDPPPLTARSPTRRASPTSATTSPRSSVRWKRESTSGAISRGRSSTTSSGSGGTTSASGSCTSTTRPSGACRRRARSATGACAGSSSRAGTRAGAR